MTGSDLIWPAERPRAASPGSEWSQARSNVCLDFHGDPAGAQLVVFSDGNHHMALAECIETFVRRSPGLHDVSYTTTLPSVYLTLLKTGELSLGNLTLRVRPNVVIGPSYVVGRLHAEGEAGRPVPFPRSHQHAMPRIGTRRVSDITSADVMSILLPIWSAKPVTANKVRGRIGAVLKWSIANGFRDDNPAGDAVGAALPKNGVATRHFPALPHGEVTDALAKVRASGAYRATVLAFEFLILTACRSGEVRGATWDKIDVENEVWAIPGERMKVHRAHRVPLSSGARATLIQSMELRDRSNLVFPSVTGRPMSDSTISKLIRENGIAAVPHGFRSSFRDWCGECSGAPREVAEAALAHVVGGVEGAYARFRPVRTTAHADAGVERLSRLPANQIHPAPDGRGGLTEVWCPEIMRRAAS